MPGERSGMVVAAVDQRGAGRAAKGGRVEMIVAQAFRRQPVHGRRGNAAAKRAELAEAAIVDQDEQDVRRALWRADRLGKPRWI
jgi:hypothetical protein